MTYQVLARKWRPRLFSELVGQEHVQRALVNALDNDRLHHAYLFTGTRGVGKTTIARILAKSLNCEAGVSSTPCGTCDSCVEIDEGRFVDLIEVDAASRTKVEDTRELLDNVQYAPTRGRYKVYLIDEVHMLSGHSFNALLKTLEEPPPHVKFLLATTDPQKLPVTILSRCLQFNLKHLSVAQICRQLAMILDKEQIAFEEGAVRQLALAADGSMRDALSLLDQAIGFGNGGLREAEVRTMLGTIDRDTVYRLLHDLAAADAAALLTEVGKVDEFAPDYSALLADMLTVLQRIAVAQTLPDAIDDTFGDRDAVIGLAGELAPEDVQLYYQIGLLGRRDLSLAPDGRGGFEMVMLRMLAFRPGNEGQDRAVETRVSTRSPPAGEQAENAGKEAAAPVSKSLSEWRDMIEELGISGLVREMALNCALQEVTEKSVVLTMEKMHAHLLNKSRTDQLEAALGRYYGHSIRLKVLKDMQSSCESPARQKAREEDERMQQAIAAIEADTNIKAMQDTFGATISYESIRPRD
jgi:DNA polymerase-3 subunit gamma/tau